MGSDQILVEDIRNWEKVTYCSGHSRRQRQHSHAARMCARGYSNVSQQSLLNPDQHLTTSLWTSPPRLYGGLSSPARVSEWWKHSAEVLQLSLPIP